MDNIMNLFITIISLVLFFLCWKGILLLTDVLTNFSKETTSGIALIIMGVLILVVFYLLSRQVIT
jgi:multisubunit Na+/H+ antiporter MnhG subunit